MAHLLDLFGLLSHLPLTSSLGSLWSGLGIHDIVPPSETTRIVANETLVVNIVMLSPGPEGKEVVQAPWEFVSAVGINGLEQTADDPEVHGEDVKLTSDQNPNYWCLDSSETEDHDFDWRRVFSGKSERSRVLVVDLVDVPVERTPMHRAMGPVMPGVLQHEEDRDLESHCLPAWKGNTSVHTAIFRHWVEKPDLG